MIANLEGVVAAAGEDHVIVRVGGLGFRVFVPQTTLEGAGGPGERVMLHTYLHVREHELTLYGFGSKEELALFRLLLTVSGIGPKVALSILSSLPPDELQTAIVQEDVVRLARVPGIGPKTAKKMAFELKERVLAALPQGKLPPPRMELDPDLIAALSALGYSLAEAQEALRALPEGSLPLEERVRLALAYFGS